MFLLLIFPELYTNVMSKVKIKSIKTDHNIKLPPIK